MKLLILGSEAVPRHEEAQLTDPTEVGPLLHRDEALIRVANSLPTRTILYAYVWFTHDKDNNAVQCVCVSPEVQMSVVLIFVMLLHIDARGISCVCAQQVESSFKY